MQASGSIRIDKWLWAVRIYKTRTLAAEACKKGQVKIDGNTVKASREVKINDVISVKVHPINRFYRVKGLLDKRLSAKLVVEFVEDVTPAEELEKLDLINFGAQFQRDRGTGRPTKKDRRDIDKLTE